MERWSWGLGGWPGCTSGQVGTPLSLSGQASSYLPGKPQLRTPTRDGRQIAQEYCMASLLFHFYAQLSYFLKERKLAIFGYNNKQWRTKLLDGKVRKCPSNWFQFNSILKIVQAWRQSPVYLLCQFIFALPVKRLPWILTVLRKALSHKCQKGLI